MSLQSEFKEMLGSTLTQIYWTLIILAVAIGLILVFMGIHTIIRMIMGTW